MGTALAAGEAVQIHAAEHLVRTYHRWTCAAAPIHDPETGAVIGVVDVTGPERTFHPTTLALVVAAARLAEGYLRTQLAVRDERLLSRNLPHLVGLRDEPGALLSPSGRVLAAQPSGWLPARVDLPAAGDRVLLAQGDEGLLEPLAEGWLLRLPRSRARPRRVLTLAFLGADPADGAARRAAGAALAAARRAAHPARAAPRGPHRRRAGRGAARRRGQVGDRAGRDAPAARGDRGRGAAHAALPAGRGGRRRFPERPHRPDRRAGARRRPALPRRAPAPLRRPRGAGGARPPGRRRARGRAPQRRLRGDVDARGRPSAARAAS